MSHIVIVGAGITGVTTAYALLERGYRVTVLDRHRYAAMETSFANGGQLSASNAEVWNSTATVAKGLRWIFRSNAPLLLNLKPNWHKYSWLAEFVGNIGNYRKNTIETTRLAIEARQHLFAMAERENISFDLERRGILHVYYDKKGFDAGLKVNELLRQGGLDRQPVTPEEIRVIEPTLHKSCYGGFFTPSDSTGDIHKFTAGLAAACVRLGATFIYDAHVEAIASADGSFRIGWRGISDGPGAPEKDLQADGVVICAGVASRHFAAMLGDRVNVYPVKGYSITIDLHTPQSRDAAPYVSLLDEAAKIVTSRLGADRLRVAGTAEFNDFNRDIRADRIQPLEEWTRHHFPDIETETMTPWAGLRPMMPDMMPVVRAGKQPGVFYNTGHGHLGWTLSGATAQIIAQVVDEWQRPDVPFSVSSPSLAAEDHNPGFTTLQSQR